MIVTIENLINLLADNAKHDSWLSVNYNVASNVGAVSVGIKCYGYWIQTAQCGRFRDSTRIGIKTKKAFKAEAYKLIASLIQAHANELPSL